MVDRRNRQAELRARLEEMRPSVITERERDALAHLLAPVSQGYLRKLLRACGVPLAPLVEGVRQDSLAELERTLLALEREYSSGRHSECRALVIEAKNHARWALRSPKLTPEQKALREEMVLWMLTWLENPPAFPAWLRLRKAYISTNPAAFNTSR
jgi:hypothetical protein